MKDKLVFIPTYNEKDNVKEICESILNLQLGLDILFLDDNSPDGTGEKLNCLAGKYDNVQVIHRPGKLGIGSAHLDGIKWAYDHNYKILITMDCDFSHDPSNIPLLLENMESNEVLVGSRYIMDNSLEGWNIHRKILTNLGHFATKYILKIPFDATGAFRLYRLDRIPQQVFDLVSSEGYSFFFESLHILSLNDFVISEIPIKLPPRTYGHSKMQMVDIKNSLSCLFSTYFKKKFNRGRFILNKGPLEKSSADLTWDEFWSKQNPSGFIYEYIARIYRKFFFRNALKYFAMKHYRQGSQILHAGCGSGQVDLGINSYVSIIALDISIKALEIYKKNNSRYSKVIHGDIKRIPLPDACLDGIYNLGVMEHFTEEEISTILAEFERVLKPNGKLILFWPHYFGLSVIFFRIVKFILNKQEIGLYPREITLLKSKNHISDICERNNFVVNDYYFGIRDFFTHGIVILSKRVPNLS